ncbi:MAG TPA: PEP-CTERM sorting domain-containing protein [Chthoniobacteraceae bacterium]|jgi:hypothetical protein
MKLYLAAAVAAAILANSTHAQTFTGNGGTGFGGTVGNGSISVSQSTPGTLSFSFTPGATFDGNALVLYFDTVSGGFTDTSSFTDIGDPGRVAISGTNTRTENNVTTTTRTLLQFPSNFAADFALAVEPGTANLFQLKAGEAHTFVQNAGLSGSGTGPFTFSLTGSNLGLAANQPFQFVGSLISTSAYRSNETFGTSSTIPGSAGDTPNAGFTGTTTITQAFTAVPEPGTIGLLALSTVGLMAIRRRR